jgi:MFS family permease
MFAVVARLPQAAFLSWGWRIPFLVSIVLVGVGFLIRIRILETPAFKRIQETRSEVRQPILEVLRRYPKEVLLAMGMRIAENGSFYVYSVFLLLYATEKVRMDRSIVLEGILIASALELIVIPMLGALSDRVGRRPVYLFGAVFTALFAFPLFWLLDTGATPLVWAGIVVAFLFSHSAMYAPQAAFLSELFGSHVRYSGASLGSQLASVLAGGLSPFIATELLRRYGSGGPVAIYVIGMAVITIISVLAARETVREDIQEPARQYGARA